MAPKQFEVGQKAFIERDGRILILFRQNGVFDFPGGRIEEGESDLRASLMREVSEETTLEIVVGSPFATWLSGAETVYLVGYKCRFVAGDVELSDEHIDFQWVDASNYHELDDGSAPYRVLRYFGQ